MLDDYSFLDKWMSFFYFSCTRFDSSHCLFFFIFFLCFSCLQGAVSLLEMVEFYKTTCKLNLAYNTKIKIRGWQALSRTLKKVKKWHD